jgi:hypothetical protein
MYSGHHISFCHYPFIAAHADSHFIRSNLLLLTFNKCKRLPYLRHNGCERSEDTDRAIKAAICRRPRAAFRPQHQMSSCFLFVNHLLLSVMSFDGGFGFKIIHFLAAALMFYGFQLVFFFRLRILFIFDFFYWGCASYLIQKLSVCNE